MSDLESMLIAMRESQTVPTKKQAGEILANGGWAVFPLPNGMKFDKGLSYLHATVDPGRFAEMADWQMQRHECRDVNIALAPGKCIVPLLVVDLDGTEAITRFWEDATGRGHADVPLWLRVNTTRQDHGRHIYFASPGGVQYSNSSHRWGGEIRSGKGHVVVPPSTTETGRYTWAGEKLYSAPDWVLEGLHAARAASGGRNMADDEISATLDILSLWAWTSYGEAAVNNLLQELADARPGDPNAGRNATLARVTYRVLDLALERQVPAMEGISRVASTYQELFYGEEGRNPHGELLRCVRSWMNNKEDLEDGLAGNYELAQWVAKRGQMTVGDEEARERIQEMTAAEHDANMVLKWTRGKRHRAGSDWKKGLNK